MATSNEQSTKNYFERFKKPIAALTLATLGTVGLSACGPSASAEKVPEKSPSVSAPATPGATETAPAPTETAAPIPIDKPSENTYSDPTEVQLSFNTPRNPNNLSYTNYPFNINEKPMSRAEYVDTLKLSIDKYKDPRSAALAFVNDSMNTLFSAGQTEMDRGMTENIHTNELTFMPSDDVVGGTASATHFFYEPAFAEALVDTKGFYGQGISVLNATADEFSGLYSMSMDSRAHSSEPYHMKVSASPEDITNVAADENNPITAESYVAQVSVNVHFDDNGSKTDTIVNRRAKHNLPGDWDVNQNITLVMVVRDGNWKVGDISGLDLEAAAAAQ